MSDQPITPRAQWVSWFERDPGGGTTHAAPEGEPTAANPRTITLCWSPEQSWSQVSGYPTRAPVHAVLGLLWAGETPAMVAYEHGLGVDEVRLLGRLADELTEIVTRDGGAG